jgi:hypothetical protein
MLNQQSSLRLARLALLRARLARCCGAVEEKNASRPLPHHSLSLLPRGLATEAAASSSSAGQAGAAPIGDQHQKYREYAFALTPEHRRVTVVATNANTAPTPVLVSTSADPERIVIRAPSFSNWTVELGPQGPEAREQSSSPSKSSSSSSPPPPPPPPLEVALPPRFCGLDVRSAGGDVTVSGSGVQEADVRIVVTASATTASTPTTITATRLRCGALLLDAGPRGQVAAKEVAASRLEVRGGRGVELVRVSALEALVEAGEKLEVGALYGRAAVLRLAGGRGGGATTPTTLPLLRVNQLSCGGDGDGDEQEQGATLEAWPRGNSPISVRVDGALSGRATVASGGGPVALAAVQASGGLRALVVDSGGGDVDVSMDTGGGGGGGGRGGARGGAMAATATATLRLQGAAELSVDPALGLSEDNRMPVYGPGARDSRILIDAGGGGRVVLKARSWMDGVMQRAREAAAAREQGRA